MKASFLVYIRAVGIYALVTLPCILMPIMYIISLFYVAIYGWFAWGLFTVIYLLAHQFRLNYPTRMLVLTLGVIVSVAFAYQMIGVMGSEENVWQSEFIWFPLAAVIAGWISLFTLSHYVAADCPGYREVVNDTAGEESIS